MALRRAFTLVELLVAIAIISVLVSLLLPAVQSARESGRRINCNNNLKQLALASLNHLDAQGFFPTGGWNAWWAGEPDRGFTHRQPAGWHYNLLPYLEQQTVHDLGKGSDPGNIRKTQAMQVAIPQYICPSRRTVQAYPNVAPPYHNANAPPVCGRSDYAANAGGNQSQIFSAQPTTISQGDAMTQSDWITVSPDVTLGTGVTFIRSEIKAAQVTDGLSKTYLLGERYINPDYYENGLAWDDDQSWNQGYDWDTMRWTHPNYPPKQDTPGIGILNSNFGSTHAGAFQMAFCDGSVHAIPYEIDSALHQNLGNRKDGQITEVEPQ
jgi:prepilin-type N-terminal cleavage/methylation domain-containing protein/prepilin-type processing-associated H-X9-DG protein